MLSVKWRFHRSNKSCTSVELNEITQNFAYQCPSLPLRSQDENIFVFITHEFPDCSPFKQNVTFSETAINSRFIWHKIWKGINLICLKQKNDRGPAQVFLLSSQEKG